MSENAVTVHTETLPAQPANQSITPMSLIRDAVAGGASIEVVRGLWDLQKEFEAHEAKKAYHAAMSEFKKNPPDIEKDAQVKYEARGGNTQYRHATLGNIATKINKALGGHGLSATWKTDQNDNGRIRVTCTITHAKGYSESTSLISDPDKSGGKNDIQAIGSTVTYLQRYTILALTGLATKDQDDDGKAATPQKQDLSKKSPEYQALMETAAMFPEIYAELTKNGEPINIQQYKQCKADIERIVDEQANQE